MLVLALDTSTPAVCAGVVRCAAADQATGNQPVLLAERTVVDPFGHAEHLIPLVTEALRDCGHRLAEIAAVVVGLGPGPFTGLRAGIASAAALGDALAVPVHGVPSHDGFAWGLTGSPLVVTDARRREVYVSAFRDGERVAGPVPLTPAAVAGWLADQELAPTARTGAAAPLLTGLLDVPDVSPATSVPVGLVGRALPALRSAVPPEPVRPMYLRRPDATEPTRRKSVLS